jgi:hypothetical protein
MLRAITSGDTTNPAGVFTHDIRVKQITRLHDEATVLHVLTHPQIKVKPHGAGESAFVRGMSALTHLILASDEPVLQEELAILVYNDSCKPVGIP